VTRGHSSLTAKVVVHGTLDESLFHPEDREFWTLMEVSEWVGRHRSIDEIVDEVEKENSNVYRYDD